MIRLGIIGQPLPIISYLPSLDYLNEIKWTGFFSENMNGIDGTCPMMSTIANAEFLVSVSDALIISESKSEYFNLAIMALKHARHLFLPVTLLKTVAEANKLIKLASEANVMLKPYKSGIFPANFYSRFAFNGNIWLIEMHHFSKVTEGSVDKNLFTNLLHNLDFILGLTHSNVVGLKATGLNMISDGVDIINARIEFDNGCAATLTCNCAAIKDEHTGTIVLKDKIMQIDFIREDAVVWNVSRSDRIHETFTADTINFHRNNEFTEDFVSFITLLNERNRLFINAEDGFRAFFLTTKIMDKVNRTTVRSA
ncbi:MAG: hypothetical protein JW973_02520 [Bacteroidales bacterium]|nr:hypothetical protein [Bacteroidales bacterium]